MADIYLAIDGKQTGPYTEDQVRLSLASGLITGDAPAWHEGLADWVPIVSLMNRGVALPDPEATNPSEPNVSAPEPAAAIPAMLSSVTQTKTNRRSLWIATIVTMMIALGVLGWLAITKLWGHVTGNTPLMEDLSSAHDAADIAEVCASKTKDKSTNLGQNSSAVMELSEDEFKQYIDLAFSDGANANTNAIQERKIQSDDSLERTVFFVNGIPDEAVFAVKNAAGYLCVGMVGTGKRSGDDKNSRVLLVLADMSAFLGGLLNGVQTSKDFEAWEQDQSEPFLAVANGRIAKVSKHSVAQYHSADVIFLAYIRKSPN